MEVQIAKRLLTVEEYYQMAEAGILKEDDRVELINGEIIKTSPINSKHAGHVNRIDTLFKKLMGDRAIVAIQNPVNINDHSVPQPDISILRFQDDFYTLQHLFPEDVFLLIEVAHTSKNYDRIVKLPLYATAGIPECWIVNVKESQIEVYRSPKRGKYSIREIAFKGDSVHFKTFDLTIQVSDMLK